MPSSKARNGRSHSPKFKLTASSIMPAAPSTSNTYVSMTRVRGGLLTPHNSITEDLPEYSNFQNIDRFSSQFDVKGKGKEKASATDDSNACEMSVSPPKVSQDVVSISGEEEAARFEADLIALDQKAIELEKELEAVREAALDMRRCFMGYWDETMDGSFNEDTKIPQPRPPTPPAEPRQNTANKNSSKANKPSSSTSPESVYVNIPPENSDEPPVLYLDPSTYFIWFDLETTCAEGDMKDIYILEIAVKITDKNFTPLDNGLSILVYHPDISFDGLVSKMPDIVVQMHNESGLLADYQTTPEGKRYSLRKADYEVAQYLRRRGILEGRGLLAGAGVAFDRAMIRFHLPKLDEMLNYQIFDTTTLWHFIRRKYNRKTRFSTKCVHRAMADIDGSINEAKMYGELVFKSPRDVAWPSSKGV